MHVATTVLVVHRNARAMSFTPLFNGIARKERNAGSHEIIVKQVLSPAPRAPSSGPDKVQQKVWHLRQENDKRLCPRSPQSTADLPAWGTIESRIPSGWLVYRQIQLTAWFQNSEVLQECRHRVLSVMYDAIGYDGVSCRIGERKAQIVGHDTRPSVSAHRPRYGDIASVNADASQFATGKEPQHSSWAASNVQDQRVRLQTLNQVGEGGETTERISVSNSATIQSKGCWS